MRSHLLAGIIFTACSSFLNDGYSTAAKPDYERSGLCIPWRSISDFNVHRLSGERVMISWHTESESQLVRFEVMRRHEMSKPFESLGTVQPRAKEDKSADYSFIDLNNFADSTYYCIKKTTTDSVIFYSITKGVEGIGKER